MAADNHPMHPVRPPRPTLNHPQHPVHPPRPTRTPFGQTTPTPGAQATPTPTLNVQSCPAEATHSLGGRLSKLFYAYPGSQRNLHASGFFQADFFSNGIHPATEPASLTLTDNTNGEVILDMPSIQFTDTGGGNFSASNEQGFVEISQIVGMYAFSFTFENPNFPPGFFRVSYDLCLNVGDDGMSIRIVCQHKPRGGFLCHQ